jgi:hypothetical protein
VLCRAGQRADERVLLAVYLPATRDVGVLPVSPSIRPGALRPQVMTAIRSEKRVALLISKPDRVEHRVGTVELKEGMDDGARQIADFNRRWEAGEIDLASVYPRLDNRELAELPGIATMLKLKGGAA